jgi:hypothetical protein
VFQVQLGWERNCDVGNCEYSSQVQQRLLASLLLLPTLLLLLPAL